MIEMYTNLSCSQWENDNYITGITISASLSFQTSVLITTGSNDTKVLLNVQHKLTTSGLLIPIFGYFKFRNGDIQIC